jgi:hypothetical protein
MLHLVVCRTLRLVCRLLHVCMLHVWVSQCGHTDTIQRRLTDAQALRRAADKVNGRSDNADVNATKLSRDFEQLKEEGCSKVRVCVIRPERPWLATCRMRCWAAACTNLAGWHTVQAIADHFTRQFYGKTDMEAVLAMARAARDEARSCSMRTPFLKITSMQQPLPCRMQHRAWSAQLIKTGPGGRQRAAVS